MNKSKKKKSTENHKPKETLKHSCETENRTKNDICNQKPITNAADIELPEPNEKTIETRPMFLANACHVCKILQGDKVTLKTCSGCHLIIYCCSDHQRQHWKEHKSFCKVVSQHSKSMKLSHLFEACVGVDDQVWRQRRFQAIVFCENKIGRVLQLYEKEMLLFPRCCVTCHQVIGQLQTCLSCHYVNYCCQEHLPVNHSCSQLRLWLDIALYQYENGAIDPPLPTKALNKYEELPESGSKELFLTKLLGVTQVMSMGNVFFNYLTEQASYPLTVIYVLQEIFRNKCPTQGCNVSDLRSLTIHLVGAELEFEGDAITKWDVFTFHLLPNLNNLKVVFIGPELASFDIPKGQCDEDFRCTECMIKNVELKIEFYGKMVYHQFCKSSSYTKPDVICAFNCGIYRKTGLNGQDMWKESIPHMIHDSIPLILTSYTKQEALDDVTRIKKEMKGGKLKVILPPQKNPYRSLRPLRNFASENYDPLMYRNQFYSVLSDS